MSSSRSSDENSEIFILFPDGSDERRSRNSSSETRRDSKCMTPVIFDESYFWSSLGHFFLLNDNHNHPTGLSKAQIDNLTIWSFVENDTLEFCSIYIVEYTEDNKLCILPCSHEYHAHCIDHWQSDNYTYSILFYSCRKIMDSHERENSEIWILTYINCYSDGQTTVILLISTFGVMLK